MKKIIISTVVFMLMLSLVSCGAGVSEIEGHGGYYIEIGNGLYGEEFESVSITNYHPYKLWCLPDYQELVQYGCVGLENEGVVYFVYIVDTSVNAEDPSAYYCAELDGETRALLCEEGTLFESEAEKSEAVEKLLDMMDEYK